MSQPGLNGSHLPTAYELFSVIRDRGASDLHLTAGAPPMVRIDGALNATVYPVLNSESVQTIVYSLLSESQRKKFEATNELDVAFGFRDVGRLRMNVYRQRGAIAAAVRLIPDKFSSFTELGLPKVIEDLVKLPSGLVVVTGPTGCGKSTTLASMIDYINAHRTGHIVTIEDPIEYVHSHKKCLINQREVGQDTDTFAEALKHVVREDPNVILIGEMRDPDTISAALTIAETGHLVFATLHTPDCAQTINRIIDVFPPHQISQARVQLSFVLQAVVGQQLLPHASGKGRVLAAEVLIVTAAVRNLIREQKVEQIQFAIQTGGVMGMQTMNQSLVDLYLRRQITYPQAIARSADPEDLRKLLQKLAPAAVPAQY